ncbi:MAG: glycosyltransferase [Candidatus Andersenbacteria bacterium]
MPTFLMSSIGLVVLYFPLGLIGAWRWSVWLAKRITALWYNPTPIHAGYRPTLSVVTPVYNETPALFRQALESWRQNDANEIIAVIDHTDKVCIEIFKDFKQSFAGAKLIITEKPGKRPALAEGSREATGEIIALVDSDTVWDADIRDKMLAPFIDKKVGGVATRQDVMVTDSLAQRLFNIHLDQRYFDEMAYLATVSNALTCLSGRTAVYRRAALLPVLEGMETEKFWGAPCVSGEDKCLTRLVQSSGWHMRYQRNVRVQTHGVSDLRTFFKQQLRWIRNSWRSDLKTLFSRWVWRDSKILALHMIDRFIQPFTLLLGPVYLVLSIYWQHWIVVAVLLAWWHVSRGIKLFAHLKHRPNDLFILPVYILSTYIMAVLKIYALFTVRRQGWITRWHKNRLKSIAWFKAVPSYAGTAVAVALLVVAVASYEEIVTENTSALEARVADAQEVNHPQITYDVAVIDAKRQAILEEIENHQFGVLEVERKDTLSELSRLLNIRLASVIEANRAEIPNPSKLEIGDKVKVPITELRNTLTPSVLATAVPTELLHVPEENTIYITGNGSAIDIPKLAARINNPDLLQEIAPGEWILRVSLFLREGATLVIDGESVKWLKLKSEDENFAWIRGYNSNILIQNTKITSWNENTNTFDLEYKKDGRSYILAKYNGRMDVLNSEIAYLGYGIEDGWGETNRHAGGVYGISWKIIDGSFNKYIVTGNVINNKFHHNYYGFYTYGVTGMIVRDNEAYENVQYGFDPHDDSNNMIIENNIARDNGNHGIIISKRCFNNIIRNNVSYDNRLHGIMMDRQSNNNIVEGNITYGHVDGIAIYDSHNNLIRNNEIRDNKRGIRANIGSSGNLFENNIITSSNRGIYIYDDAHSNIAFNNILTDNEIGVYLRKTTNNLIAKSLIKDQNDRELKELESSDNRVEITK